jgi:hypothetical protein
MISFPNMYNTSYQKCNVFPLCPYFFSMAMEKNAYDPYMGHTNGKELIIIRNGAKTNIVPKRRLNKKRCKNNKSPNEDLIRNGAKTISPQTKT